jgi:FlaA1/EpsC-like NDP-sugar epimerase
MFAGEFRKQKALFAVADALAFAFAGSLALILHDPNSAMRASAQRADPRTLLEGVAIAALLWFGVFPAFDLYQMRNGSRKEAIAIIKACTVAAALMLLAAFAAHFEASRIFVGIFYLLSVPAVIGTRMLLRSLILLCYSSPGIATPLVVIGFNLLAKFLCDRIEEEITHYEIIGFLDSGSHGSEYCGYPVLGHPEQMRNLQRVHPCLEAVVAMPDASLAEQAKMVELCESAMVGGPLGLSIDPDRFQSRQPRHDSTRRTSPIEYRRS